MATARFPAPSAAFAIPLPSPDRVRSTSTDERSLLQRILEALGAGERASVSVVGRRLVEALPGGLSTQEMQAREQHIWGRPAQYYDELLWAKYPIEDASRGYKIQAAARAVPGVILGMALDPLSYVGVGLLTRGGKASKVVTQARRIAQTDPDPVVRLARMAEQSPELGDAVRRMGGVENVMREGVKGVEGWANEVSRGHRRLLGLQVPLTRGALGANRVIPLLPSFVEMPLAKGAAFVGQALAKIPPVAFMGRLFIPNFRLMQKFPGLVPLKRAMQAEDAAAFIRAMDDAADLMKRVPDLATRKKIAWYLEIPHAIEGKDAVFQEIRKVVDPGHPEVVKLDLPIEGPISPEQAAGYVRHYLEQIIQKGAAASRELHLGSGHWGKVKAFNEYGFREYIVKMPNPKYEGAQRATEALRKEAQTYKALGGIEGIGDAHLIEIEGKPYLVKKRLEFDPRAHAWQDAGKMEQLERILWHAANKGISLGDLHPGNVKVDMAGKVWVIDVDVTPRYGGGIGLKFDDAVRQQRKTFLDFYGLAQQGIFKDLLDDVAAAGGDANVFVGYKPKFLIEGAQPIPGRIVEPAVPPRFETVKEMVEPGIPPADIPDDLRREILGIQMRRRIAEEQLLKRGILTEEVVNEFRERTALNHLSHIRMPGEPGLSAVVRAIKSIIRAPDLDSLKFRKLFKGAELYGQKLVDGTLEEINRIAIQNTGKPFFIEDMAIILGIEQRKIGQAVAAHDYLNQIAHMDFVKPAKQVAGDFVADLPGYVVLEGRGVGYRLFKGLQIPEEIAEDIRKSVWRMSEKNAMDGVVGIFDKIQNIWKSWTLGIFPGYHVRNVIGNLWNNGLADVQIRSYKDALRMQRGVEMAIQTPYGRLTNKEVMALAEQMGVIRLGQFGGDIPVNLARRLSPGRIFTLDPDSSILLRAGFKVGSLAEDNARLAHFIDKLRRGMTAQDAAMSVKRYLFDYTDLTDFERGVLKRMLPFYTWTRKNVPLQVRELFRKPGRFLAVERGRRLLERVQGVSEEEGPNEKYMPDWMHEAYPIRVRKGPDGTFEYFLLENWLPAQDIQKLAKPGQTVMEMLTPILKAPIEWATNYSVFLRRQVERPLGENVTFLGVPMRGKMANLLRNVRILSEIDRTNPGAVFGTADEPGIFGYKRTDRLDLPGITRIFQFLTGARGYPYDPQKFRRFYVLETRGMLAEMQRAIRKAALRGKDFEVRRLREEMIRYSRERGQ